MPLKPREQGRFNIYRYYAQEGKPKQLKARNLTWERTLAWVTDPNTSRLGDYFDGFEQVE